MEVKKFLIQAINLHRQQPLISLMVWVNALIAGSVLPLVFSEAVLYFTRRVTSSENVPTIADFTDIL